MLTQAEREFLARLNLTEADVLDGRHLSQRGAKDAAKREGKTLVLGSACKKARHRLRTRAGHCAECDISRVAHERRYVKPGTLYLLLSKAKRLVKIGVAESSLDQRVRQLCFEEYGGASDWRVVRAVKVANAGTVEHAAQAKLAAHSHLADYLKNGEVQQANEVFSCDLATALAAFDEAIGTL